MLQALIVAPSQELCMQIVRVAQGLLPDEARSAVQQCIGGANILRQMDAIAKNKPLVVVGTPGRLAQLVKSAALQLHGCPLLVMDEVRLSLVACVFVLRGVWFARLSCC